MKKDRKVSLTIETVNLIGRKQKNVNVRLIRIDDYFYSGPKGIEGITNEEGIVNFESILEGSYLIQILTGKVFLEKIKKIRDNKSMRIRLPFLFRKRMANTDKLKKIYEKNRTDNELCFKCKNPYKAYTDKFLCKYCEKYFCSHHRVPETHACWGTTVAPQGGFRELHSRSGITVKGTGEPSSYE